MDIVFIPGLNNTGDVFRDVSAALPAHLRSHCPDLPPLEHIEALADAVLAAAPARFYLAGYSFGGYVALGVLEKARERVRGLCLMGSSARADSDAQKLKRQQAIQSLDVRGHRVVVGGPVPPGQPPAARPRGPPP
jgi:pimeloyl-ACP methyl ester carboxylesterase